MEYVSLMCYICILNIQAVIEPTQMLHTLGYIQSTAKRVSITIAAKTPYVP